MDETRDDLSDEIRSMFVELTREGKESIIRSFRGLLEDLALLALHSQEQ